MKIFVILLFMFSTPLVAADIDLTSVELKVIEEAIQIPDEVSEGFIIMHNKAFDENRKTFVYDDGETYLVGSEKIDIKDAVVTVESVHYCKKESGYVFQTSKPCKLLSQASEKLVEVYLTPEEFLALQEKNEKIKEQVEAKILAKKKERGDASFILADLENTTLGGPDEQTFDTSCIYGDCENGLGIFVWDNGDQYEGAWKDGKPHGEGTFDWRNRIKYVGEWRDGKMHGQGTKTFPDGSNHIGKWKNGKKHGWIMTTGGSMGAAVYEWKDGVRGEWFGQVNWEYVFKDDLYTDGDIFTKKDPTTFQDLVFVEEKLMETFDRRFKSTQLIKRRIIHGKMNVANHFVFKATFENDHNVTVAVNAEFKTKGKAEKTALKYIKIVGQLPTFLREGINFIVIHKGKAEWGGGANKIYIHTGDLNHKFNEEVMVHEAGHAVLDWGGMGLINQAEWAAVQLEDKKFISKYAQEYHDQEDVAETILWWIAVRCKPDRISKKNYKKVLEAIPNRLKYFDEQNYDTYPLVCNFE